MPTPKRGARLAGGPAQQKSMLRNQATELFRHGRIRTTEARARLLRPYAEKLITKAKAGDLHKRRQVLAELRDRDVVAYLFEDIGPRFADRNGGYTRILKLAPRKGDNARMAIIELVDRGMGGSGEEVIEESKAGRSRGLFGRRRRRQAEEVGAGLATAVTDAVEDATEAVSDRADDLAESADSGVVENAAETLSDAADSLAETAEEVRETAEEVIEGEESEDSADTDDSADSDDSEDADEK